MLRAEGVWKCGGWEEGGRKGDIWVRVCRVLVPAPRVVKVEQLQHHTHGLSFLSEHL